MLRGLSTLFLVVLVLLAMGLGVAGCAIEWIGLRMYRLAAWAMVKLELAHSKLLEWR